METFEFLNICQVHGFPKIMGVLTHLDSFRDNKKMRKMKKQLKHRFWTEVYQVSNLDYCGYMEGQEFASWPLKALTNFWGCSIMWKESKIFESSCDYPQATRKSRKGNKVCLNKILLHFWIVDFQQDIFLFDRVLNYSICLEQSMENIRRQKSIICVVLYRSWSSDLYSGGSLIPIYLWTGINSFSLWPSGYFSAIGVWIMARRN